MDSGYEWLDGLYRVKVKKGATLTKSDKHPGLFSSNTRLNGFPGGPCELCPASNSDIYQYLTEEEQLKLFSSDEPLTNDQQYKLARNKQWAETIGRSVSDAIVDIGIYALDNHVAPFFGKLEEKAGSGIRKLMKKDHESVRKSEINDGKDQVQPQMQFVNSNSTNQRLVINHTLSQEEAAKEFYLMMLFYKQMTQHLNNLQTANVKFTDTHSLDGSGYGCWAIENQEEVYKSIPQSFDTEIELLMQQIERMANNEYSLEALPLKKITDDE